MCAICGCGHQHQPATRRVKLGLDVLAKNDGHARANRALLQSRGTLALNLMSSPGSGKTTLLSRTLGEVGLPAWVIVGDPHSRNDADRLKAAGVGATQINTGRGCHLDAHAVGHALENLQDVALIVIENVGNLVCPAEFDLGESKRVVLLSVTEGDDKPLKYANLFARADLVVITKIDLLPHVEFDVDRALELARRCRPGIETLALSAKSGAGMPEWQSWLRSQLPGGA